MENPTRVQACLDAYLLNYRTLAKSRRVDDLRWRIQFTQMKLSQWRDSRCAGWLKLKALQENAVSELKQLEAA